MADNYFFEKTSLQNSKKLNVDVLNRHGKLIARTFNGNKEFWK